MKQLRLLMIVLALLTASVQLPVDPGNSHPNGVYQPVGDSVDLEVNEENTVPGEPEKPEMAEPDVEAPYIEDDGSMGSGVISVPDTDSRPEPSEDEPQTEVSQPEESLHPDASEDSETSSNPGTSSPPETSSRPETPSRPSIPWCPEIPLRPILPWCPEAPSQPDVPSLPDTPSQPDTPSKPDTPSEPESPVPPSSEPETPDTDTDMLSYAEQVVKLVNQERAKAGLAPLTLSQPVASAAQVRAKEITQSFSHTRPDGRSFSTALTEQNVSYRSSGENIAWGQKTPEQVMQGWMNSEGHRKNIMNAKFTSIGVGYHRNASGVNYWTQLFIG
ncbi:CAP domain-containing protein [Clostridium sp. D33t1_170424_F3]|uniref:CAP domain-containing protein n=1 Tax=Clostridium sp. D33t1_170424_F3 TaxID=2787099 RepID=UPI0025702282|nr:CAP domain-containing protein [Clostridium sp. D33t1_170424_F3]